MATEIIFFDPGDVVCVKAGPLRSFCDVNAASGCYFKNVYICCFTFQSAGPGTQSTNQVPLSDRLSSFEANVVLDDVNQQYKTVHCE